MTRGGSGGGWLTTRNQKYCNNNNNNNNNNTNNGNKNNNYNKRSRSEAFSSDWGTYENRSSHYGGSTSTRQERYSINPPPPPSSQTNSNMNSNMNSNFNPASATSYPNRHQKTHNNNYNSKSQKRQFPNSSSSSTTTTTTTTSSSSSLPPPTLPPWKKNRTPTVTLPSESENTHNLSPEQKLVVESVLSGYSTFFTGPAGSGKSHVLSSILKWNEQATLAPKKRIVLTATTGISACNISGTTIHSFAGVGTGQGSLSQMVAKVMGNEYARQRWREVDLLIIDEISMMPAQFFDVLNIIAQRARNNRQAFGGLQLVVCGDFFQLPPVNLNKNQFCFEAKCWSNIIQSSILLKHVFRQEGDTTLMQILTEARIGELSSKSVALLEQHCWNPPQLLPQQRHHHDVNTRMKPTTLECRNQQVDQVNFYELSKLPGPTYTYHAKDVAVSPAHSNQLKNNCAAPTTLNLKVGAQVMLLKNLDPDHGLVNGSRGVIVGFEPNSKINQDLPREFRNLEFPVVQFDALPGMSHKSNKSNHHSSSSDALDEEEEPSQHLRKIMEPSEWVNKVGDHVISSRIQIPLRLAWALSVHKSQGMTIPHLTVSLEGVFEYGQAYVALSRATHLRYLKLKGFHAKAFKAHPTVKAFYKRLALTGGVEEKQDNQDNNDEKKSDTSQSNGHSQSSVSLIRVTNSLTPCLPLLSNSSPNHRHHTKDDENGVALASSKPMIPTISSSSSQIQRQHLTEAQQKRLEENKMRALELQRKRKEQQLQQQQHQPSSSSLLSSQSYP